MRREYVARAIVVRLLVVLAVLGAVHGCAARTSPPRGGGPAFPEFVFPAIPPDVGAARVAADHQRAWQALQAGDVRAAERRFASMLRRAPEFYPAEAGLGYVQVARQGYQEATELFDKVLAKKAGYAPALAGRGQVLVALGREAEAVVAFEGALDADPSLLDVRRRVDLLRFRLTQEALAAARQAVEEGRYAEAQAAYERAIAVSPDSPFLYRELALAEQGKGLLDQARRHAQRATELDATDGRAWLLVGELEDAAGNLDAAEQAYARARAVEASALVEQRLADVRARIQLTKLPPQYRAIPGVASITRGELAALVGVRFDQNLRRAHVPRATVITDTRGHWAAPWILSVTEAGVMDEYPNHTFQPETVVHRGDLALVVSRLLGLIVPETPRTREWREARYDFADLEPGHLSYPAAAVAVQTGVMSVLDGNAFHLSLPVTGAEAVAAMDRLEALAERPR